MADLGNGTTITYSGISANLIEVQGPSESCDTVET